MRTLMRAGAFVAVASAALLTAPSALASAPGDNGTVKIHDAKTGEELVKNEPKVCTFYLDGFKFDGAQKVVWHIEAWANNDLSKGTTVTSGSLTLDGSGHERTADMTLPDGQYKLFWNFDNEHGKAKHKVFSSDCEGSGGGGTAPSGSPSASVSASVSASPSGTVGASASPGSSSGAGASVSASVSASPSAQGGSGDLAETGSGAPVGLLSGVAAALVAAGGGLVLWRRRAARG
ncbi:LPXTG cell wall anchor domain-containing protein [Streptomyces sp. NPDC051104]|uniref:LPXTG cell wall anchor domain-containing protein n=1 Tax=Streptomyces sp. NPDC051104 TaxID=3155044 RepID=UPI003417A932